MKIHHFDLTFSLLFPIWIVASLHTPFYMRSPFSWVNLPYFWSILLIVRVFIDLLHWFFDSCCRVMSSVDSSIVKWALIFFYLSSSFRWSIPMGLIHSTIMICGTLLFFCWHLLFGVDMFHWFFLVINFNLQVSSHSIGVLCYPAWGYCFAELAADFWTRNWTKKPDATKLVCFFKSAMYE